MSTTIKLRFSPDARWRFARFILTSSLLLASCYGMVALTALPVTTAISAIVLAALAAATLLFIYNQFYKCHANIKKQSPMQAFVLTAFSLISALALFTYIGPIMLTVAAISSASVAALSLAIYELAFKQKKVDAMLFKEMEKTLFASLSNNLSFLQESARTKYKQSIARVTTLCQAGANPLCLFYSNDAFRSRSGALVLAIQKHQSDAVEAMLEHSHALTITSGLLSETYNAYLRYGEEVDGTVAAMTEQSTPGKQFACIAQVLETPKQKAMKILSTILNHPNYSEDLHPLIHAVNSKNKKIVEATVTASRTVARIEVNATDAEGNTALMHCAGYQSLLAATMLKTLLMARADPNIESEREQREQTALHIALRAGQYDNIALLLQYKAEIPSDIKARIDRLKEEGLVRTITDHPDYFDHGAVPAPEEVADHAGHGGSAAASACAATAVAAACAPVASDGKAEGSSSSSSSSSGSESGSESEDLSSASSTLKCNS
jgi:hypothetical protein